MTVKTSHCEDVFSRFTDFAVVATVHAALRLGTAARVRVRGLFAVAAGRNTAAVAELSQ